MPRSYYAPPKIPSRRSHIAAALVIPATLTGCSAAIRLKLRANIENCIAYKIARQCIVGAIFWSIIYILSSIYSVFKSQRMFNNRNRNLNRMGVKKWHIKSLWVSFYLPEVSFSTLCSCAATDSSAVVGYVDEHPITMEEFNYFLSQQKSSVCQSYSQLYGITSFDSAFWNSEYGDSTPLDSARASAKEACLEAYATQMLAEKTTSAEFLSFPN